PPMSIPRMCTLDALPQRWFDHAGIRSLPFTRTQHTSFPRALARGQETWPDMPRACQNKAVDLVDWEAYDSVSDTAELPWPGGICGAHACVRAVLVRANARIHARMHARAPGGKHMASDAESSVDRRLVQLFRHLGLAQVHIAARVTADWHGLATMHPETIA